MTEALEPVTDFLGATLPLADILAVYLLFRLKHFMADYLLQTSWMVRGKERAGGLGEAPCSPMPAFTRSAPPRSPRPSRRP